jgi:ABC-2 type transport system permease protein
MTEILVIVKKDLRELFRGRAFLISIAIAAFLVFAFITAIRENLAPFEQQGVPVTEAASYLQPLVGATVFFLCLMLMMLFGMYINSYTLVIEKTKRSLESLLCTPISIRQLWIGKSLAMFIPSVILGFAFTGSAFCVMNAYIVLPAVGRWFAPGAAPLVATLVAVPLFVLVLSFLFTLLQLVLANIRWVTGIFMGVIFGAEFGLTSSLRLTAASWSIVYVSLGIVVILAVAVFLSSRLLTKERIILSSKG